MLYVQSALGTFELFKNAIQAVMQDEGFKVPAHALETTRSLIKWTSDPTNVTLCLTFCDELCYNLQQCLPSSSSQVKRKKMLVSTINYIHLKYFMTCGEGFSRHH